jgi:hypothetical protein
MNQATVNLSKYLAFFLTQCPKHYTIKGEDDKKKVLMLRNSPKIRVETDIFEAETIRFCIWAKTDDMDSMEPRFEMKFDHISEFVSRDIEGSDVVEALKVLLKSGATKQPRKSKEEKTLEDFQAEALKKAEYQKNLRAKMSDEKKEAEKLKRKERDAKRKAEEKKRKAENIAKAAAEAEATEAVDNSEEMSENSETTNGTDEKTEKKKRKNAKKERVDEYGHDLPEFDISRGKKAKEPVDPNKVMLRPIEIGDKDGEKTKYYIDPKTNRVYSNDRNKFLVGRYVVSEEHEYSEILKFETVEGTPYLRCSNDDAFIVAQDLSLTKVGDWNENNELELDEEPEEMFWPAPSGL